MKSKYLITLYALAISLSFAACEKIFLDENGNNTPTANFNLLWDEFNQGYVYFDYKDIDWDSIKTVYEPQINDNMSDADFFDVLATMIETLRDGHVTFRQNIMNTRSYDFTEGFSPNFNKEFVIENYLLPNDMDTTTFIRHCFLDNDIGYLYYSTFTNEITTAGMEEILAKYANTRGLIIDVRGNLGGDASNIHRLIEHFVAEPTVVGLTQEKASATRNDFTTPQETLASPAGTNYNKPIIVLSNRECYSACNAFVAYMSLLPNVTLLGDRTGGGGGLPITKQLNNGWFFTYSATIGRLPDGFITEDGILPDVLIQTDESFEAQGLDNIIEQAIMNL